jgi:hypothetical protein
MSHGCESHPAISEIFHTHLGPYLPHGFRYNSDQIHSDALFSMPIFYLPDSFYRHVSDSIFSHSTS